MTSWGSELAIVPEEGPLTETTRGVAAKPVGPTFVIAYAPNLDSHTGNDVVTRVGIANEAHRRTFFAGGSLMGGGQGQEKQPDSDNDEAILHLTLFHLNIDPE